MEHPTTKTPARRLTSSEPRCSSPSGPSPAPRGRRSSPPRRRSRRSATSFGCGGRRCRRGRPEARWFGGSVVRWFGGSVVRWFGGSVVRWFGEGLVRCVFFSKSVVFEGIGGFALWRPLKKKTKQSVNRKFEVWIGGLEVRMAWWWKMNVVKELGGSDSTTKMMSYLLINPDSASVWCILYKSSTPNPVPTNGAKKERGRLRNNKRLTKRGPNKGRQVEKHKEKGAEPTNEPARKSRERGLEDQKGK